jgi:WD40 repeat protein
MALRSHFVAEYRCSKLVQFSPDAAHLATTQDKRLVIRDAHTLKIVPNGVRPCSDSIDSLAWSPDGDLVLCVLLKEAAVQVFSLSLPDWSCRISEGIAGLASAAWVPDSRHLLTSAELGLHLSIWSLCNQKVWQIRQPKPAPACLAFSPDAALLAVATRRDCKDHLSLYDASAGGGWACLCTWPLDTVDLAGVSWAPDGTALCVQDTVLEYRLQVYSLQGELLARYAAYENALGIKAVQWSPDGAFLAVGSYDQVLKLDEQHAIIVLLALLL